MYDILFITFDVKKDEYPAMSYSVAVLIAALKKAKQKVGHYSIDVQHALEEKDFEESLTVKITRCLKDNLSYFKKFRFIAISLTSWSIEYCQSLMELLIDYRGRIILGGYEVTSMSEEMLNKMFPRADYFIKGYAERILTKIVAENYIPDSNIVQGKIESNDLASPYLMGVINIFSRKIYWETKRGCPFRCGFCEWGNATKSIIENGKEKSFIDIDKERLFIEIESFRESSIDEINILDGTFNLGHNYLEIFKELLGLGNVKITCQARFENIFKEEGEEFLRLCRENRHKVHLEFGLQTIHKNEMDVIGRDNDPEKVEKALKILKDYKIDYETSIIYAIPGQTVESFIDTIEFLITRGCKNIKAYPLRIPKNSKLDAKRGDMFVNEEKNKYNVTSVVSSYSFPYEQREDMDIIANRLNSGQLFTDIESLGNEFKPEDYFIYKEATQYQWEILDLGSTKENQPLIAKIISDYMSTTIKDIAKEDFRQEYLALGKAYSHKDTDRMDFIKDIISGKFCFELKNWDMPNIEEVKDKFMRDALKSINTNHEKKKYRCKVRISKSSNVYVYREIILIN